MSNGEAGNYALVQSMNYIRHQDISILISEIERLKNKTGDDAVTPEIWEDEIKNFIGHYADPLIYLLDELRHYRDAGAGDVNLKSTHRAILEGFSDESPAAALSEALDKAAFYFSEQHDISITLQKLTQLPQGGHRAIVEVHITPVTFRHHLHVEAPDVELKLIHDHDYDSRKKMAEEHIKHLVFDHFATTNGGRQAQIPDYFLININDAYLMNHLIEKEFFNAGHHNNIKDPEPEPTPPRKVRQILVRVQKPFPHPE